MKTFGLQINRVGLLALVIAMLGAIGGNLLSSGSVSAATAPAHTCQGDTKLVNAIPSDFIAGANVDAARTGKGLLCVNKNARRRIVTGPNGKTIVAIYPCPVDSTIGYDRNGAGGHGFEAHALVQSKYGGAVKGIKTYYCVKTSDLYHDLFSNGRRFTYGPHSPRADYHKYHFYPAYDLRKGCSRQARVRSGCYSNYFFSYNGTADRANPFP